jgi:Ca2+-binding EF-hand superfamily protein
MSDRHWLLYWLGAACGLLTFTVVRIIHLKKQKYHAEKRKQQKYIHRGVTCSICEQSPLEGVRYKCVNCVNFDICEQCEEKAMDLHDRTHLFLKIRIPLPPLAMPSGPFLPVLYPGKEPHTLSLNKNEVRVLQRLTHFDEVEIEHLFEQFKSLAHQGGIDKATFEKCLGPLGIERNLITDRLFAFFDQDGNGKIDFSELVCGLSVLCKGTQDEKIRYAFRGYDLDGDGYITKDELYKMFKAYFFLSKEAIKDALKVVEADALTNFDEATAEPVSSAFSQLQSRHSSSTDANNTNVPTKVALLSSEDHTNPMTDVEEALYQQAIEQLAERAFRAADINRDGKISFQVCV